mgnify:CR=1 FL=1
MKPTEETQPNSESSAESSVDMYFALKAEVAENLKVNDKEADQITGSYFLSEVESDVASGANEEKTLLDTDAALVSGAHQLISFGFDGNFNKVDYFDAVNNPIVKLEGEHPDLVTEGVAELSKTDKTSKYASFIANIMDKTQVLIDKATPVFGAGPDGKAISLHEAKKYIEFSDAVKDARVKLQGYDGLNHGQPTLDEFNKWKKTGEINPGVNTTFSAHEDSSKFGFVDTTPYETESSWPLPSKIPPSDDEFLLDPLEQELPGHASHSMEEPAPQAENEDNMPSSASYWEANKATQNDIFTTYTDNINPELVDAKEVVEPAEVARLLELEHSVKFAPSLSDQVEDKSRINQIIYLKNRSGAGYTYTSSEEYRSVRENITEHNALQELDAFLELAADKLSGSTMGDTAVAMREKLTYVGEKEYREAAAGIANYWKAELDKNPSLQIYAVVGEIAKTTSYVDKNQDIKLKSDDYLLEHILKNFSEEDLALYGQRLIVDAEDINVTRPEDLKVVLLDDWTISGMQIKTAAGSFKRSYPQFARSVEVQLVAANESRIKNGLTFYDYNGVETNVPLRAYFKAHNSEQGSNSGSHITGSHSSVDFDFEMEISEMVHYLKTQGEEVTMVPPTNIVRPYRYDGVSRSSFSKSEQVRRRSRQRQNNDAVEL